jgi:hypothetical protein
MKKRLNQKPIATQTPKNKEIPPHLPQHKGFLAYLKKTNLGDRCFFKSKIMSFQSRLIHLRQGGDSA